MSDDPRLTPEVKAAMEKARVKMRADLEKMLADQGLTPAQITEFVAELDKIGEELRKATTKADDGHDDTLRT